VYSFRQKGPLIGKRVLCSLQSINIPLGVLKTFTVYMKWLTISDSISKHICKKSLTPPTQEAISNFCELKRTLFLQYMGVK